MRYRFGFALCLVAGLIVLASACKPIGRNHGYIPSDEALAEIIVGVDTRATVQDRLGPPSAAGLQNESGIFYVRSQRQSYGAGAARIADREVMAISFDAQDVVQNIERFGLEHGRIVRLAHRTTGGGVTDTTFLRQLFGNLGRPSLANFGGG